MKSWSCGAPATTIPNALLPKEKSYAIVQDPTGILCNLNQYWKRSYSIIDKVI